MSRRKRKHIPLIELLASALCDKLPKDQAAKLRETKPPAKQIVRMFTPDHIDLHSLGGSDKWWNIDMRPRGADLKEKDRKDTGVAAKTKRIVAEQLRHLLATTPTGKLRAKKEKQRNKKKKPDWQCGCGRPVFGSRCRNCGSDIPPI
jgi:hypothetical protein